MTATRTTRLADLTAPRPKPRYAPLTAGLLARKGEAAPATSFYTADPHHAHSGVRMALPAPEHEDDIFAGDWAGEPRVHWRAHRPFEEPHPHFPVHESVGALAHEPHAAHVHVAAAAPAPDEAPCAALQVELELEVLARLVLEARRAGLTPSRLIETALAAHLPATGPCPLCESHRG